MKLNWRLVSILAGSLLVGSCGRSSDAVTTSKLQVSGSWETGCISGTEIREIRKLRYEGTTETFIGELYKDAECTELMLTMTTKTTYRIGKKVSAPDGAWEYDKTFIEAKALTRSQTLADQLNALQFAGYNDWAPNVEKDLSGRSISDKKVPNKGDVRFDVVKQTGEVLNFGQDADASTGTAADKRPNSLESVSFSKVQ